MYVYMMRGDATTGKGSWRRAREYIYVYIYIYLSYIILKVITSGDMEMSPTYTDMYVKTMPGKMTEGGCPNVIENKKMMVHQRYRKRARSTNDIRDRHTTPGRSRLLAANYAR